MYVSRATVGIETEFVFDNALNHMKYGLLQKISVFARMDLSEILTQDSAN